MLFETLGQAQIFLAMAACGAIAAALYDLMDAARPAFGKVGARITEVLFAAAACALMLMTMIRTEQEGLRGYVLLGTAVGWFLYACSLSVMLHRICEKIRIFWRKIRRDNG